MRLITNLEIAAVSGGGDSKDKAGKPGNDNADKGIWESIKDTVKETVSEWWDGIKSDPSNACKVLDPLWGGGVCEYGTDQSKFQEAVREYQMCVAEGNINCVPPLKAPKSLKN